MVLIENRSDTGYVLFFQFFDYAINNAYLLYKHNCKLFDMPPKELLDFRADPVKLLIRRSRDLIYLKFVATDFFPKIISPSAGENSGDLA